MKKNIFILIILMLSCTISFSQINYQFGVAPVTQETVGKFELSVSFSGKNKAADIDNFLKKTTVAQYDSALKMTKDAFLLSTKLSTKQIDSIKKIGKIENLNLADFFTDWSDGRLLSIQPYLGLTKDKKPVVDPKKPLLYKAVRSTNPPGEEGKKEGSKIDMALLLEQIPVEDFILPVSLTSRCCNLLYEQLHKEKDKSPKDAAREETPPATASVRKIESNCCADIINPCDSIDMHNGIFANKILYLANKNLTVYYNESGQPTIIGKVRSNKKIYKNGLDLYNNYHIASSSLKFRRNINVPAGNGLGFHIININPNAFDVDIKDTALMLNIESGALLEPLLNPTGRTTLSAGHSGATPVVADPRDTLRVVVFHMIADLNMFFQDMKNASIYQHNALVRAKITVRNYIDNYLLSHFNKPPTVSLNSFLREKLSKDSVDIKMINAINEMYEQLAAAAFYPMANNIPQVQGQFDQIRILFSIKAKDNTPYHSLVVARDDHAIVAHPKGGFKIDVSSGIYTAPNFNSDLYAVRPDSILVTRPSTNVQDSMVKGNKIIQENVGTGEFGFASFLHFYPKINPSVNIAFTVGAGMNFNDNPQLRYFIGGSLLLGKENRVALSGGLIIGNATRLSKQYDNVSQHNNFIPTTETSAITYKKLITRGFLSVSYSLGFIKKKSNTTQTVTPKDVVQDATPSKQPAAPADTTDTTGGKKPNSKGNNKSSGENESSDSSSASPNSSMQAASLEKVITNSKKFKVKN